MPALDAAFLAGAGLGALDACLRLAPPWAGVWRNRLALTAAAASMRLIGRREDEAALRDDLALRRPADDPGPAGRALVVWRSLRERSDPRSAERVEAAAVGFGLATGDDLAGIVAAARELAASDRPGVLTAAKTARRVAALRPDAELRAFWLADAVLAVRLRWSWRETPPVHPLAGQILHPSLKTASGGRPRPADADWPRLCSLAYARAAWATCDLGADLARRADRLNGATPKLRARGCEHSVQRSWGAAGLLLTRGFWSAPSFAAAADRESISRASPAARERDFRSRARSTPWLPSNRVLARRARIAPTARRLRPARVGRVRPDSRPPAGRPFPTAAPSLGRDRTRRRRNHSGGRSDA